MLLLYTGFSKRLLPLFLVYCLALALAIASRIPLALFVKRVWIFVPLFTGLVALPAIFNVITPGESVLTLITFSRPPHFGPFSLPETISITRQGLHGAVLLILRVAVSVSLGILLVMTTRWMDLLHALSVLKVPRPVILVLAMTYRYIHLFLRGLVGMLLARKSRQFAPAARCEEQDWISSRVGVLVGKSYHLSTEIHLAMMSRGWSGNPRSLEQFHFRIKDAVCAACALIIAASGFLLEKMT